MRHLPFLAPKMTSQLLRLSAEQLIPGCELVGAGGGLDALQFGGGQFPSSGFNDGPKFVALPLGRLQSLFEYRSGLDGIVSLPFQGANLAGQLPLGLLVLAQRRPHLAQLVEEAHLGRDSFLKFLLGMTDERLADLSHSGIGNGGRRGQVAVDGRYGREERLADNVGQEARYFSLVLLRRHGLSTSCCREHR